MPNKKNLLEESASKTGKAIGGATRKAVNVAGDFVEGVKEGYKKEKKEQA